MREAYEVDLHAPDSYDVSALIISLWLCPEEEEKVRRESIYMSLCSWFIRDRASREPKWAERPQWIIPNQACWAEKNIRADLNSFVRRLRDRVAAGDIAIPFLQEAETGKKPKLPPEVRRLTLNEIVDFALPRHGMPDAGNLKSRVWRPSRPVLHLCAAWVTLAQEHFKEHGTPLDPMEAMLDPGFLERFLRRAELMEPLIERSRLSVSADELIKFRLLPNAGVKNK